ncbi:hypothetical protein Tco_1286747, partial [Tanacetum coccineum]
ESLEFELLHPDQGESLVIQHVLSVATFKCIDDDLWRQNNIFRTKCTSKVKNYTDEVWCEVVPMDVYHIFLGSSWQFDTKAKHDGFLNTYSFRKDRMGITLAPLDSKKSPEVDSTLVLNRVYFENVAKINPLVFMLFVEEANKWQVQYRV